MRGQPEQSPPTRAEFVAGVRAQLPILLGVAPFGLIFGALAVGSGIPPLAAQGFSLFVFAGSAQFIAAGLIGVGAPPVVVILTVFIVNLRHLLYSATMAPYYQPLPKRWKAALAWLLTDEAFATTSVRYRQPDIRYAHWFAFGTGLALWATWQISTALGILLGTSVPQAWQLDFALPLTFMALLAPALVHRPSVAAAATAGVLSIVFIGLPLQLGLIVAVLLAVIVAVVVDMRDENR